MIVNLSAARYGMNATTRPEQRVYRSPDITVPATRIVNTGRNGARIAFHRSPCDRCAYICGNISELALVRLPHKTTETVRVWRDARFASCTRQLSEDST